MCAAKVAGGGRRAKDRAGNGWMSINGLIEVASAQGLYAAVVDGIFYLFADVAASAYDEGLGGVEGVGVEEVDADLGRGIEGEASVERFANG